MYSIGSVTPVRMLKLLQSSYLVFITTPHSINVNVTIISRYQMNRSFVNFETVDVLYLTNDDISITFDSRSLP